MTDYFGNIGTRTRTRTTFANVPRGVKNASAMYFVRETINVPEAVVSGDRVFLGTVPSSARLDYRLSTFSFTDFGSTVTADIGTDDSLYGDYLSGSSTKLATAVDVATAAGYSPVLENVGIANHQKQLWDLLGMTRDPNREIELWWTFGGAGNPVAGTITIDLFGSN